MSKVQKRSVSKPKKGNNKNKINIDDIISDPISYANSVSIKELVNLLHELSDAYYNTDTPLVSDSVFDALRDVLEQRDKNNPFLKMVGAPITKRDTLEVQLPFSMGSLDKIKPEKQNLEQWKQKYKGPYVLSDKLDGISAQVYKSNGTFKMYTRGDGKKGQDISHLNEYLLKGVNLDAIPDKTSIRGEIIISKKNFETISDTMKNARNTVSGIVNSKTLDATYHKLAKLCDFIVYSIINPRYLQSEQMAILKSYGFKVVHYSIEKDLTFEELNKQLIERRAKGEYEVDGIVVVDNGKVYEHTDGNPDHAFAFKALLSDQVAIATVTKVNWDVSMDAYLKPTIEIKPINLVGVTITNATAFNADFVEKNKLGPGAKVKIARSGDVIPHILEVIEPAANGAAQMPNVPYVWTDTHVDIYLQDLFGAYADQVITKRLVHFFSTIGAKYISEGIVTKLVANGYKTVEDIIQANTTDLAKIDGLGKKIVDKIRTSITEALESITLTLPILMDASHIFGRGIGEKKINEIFTKYPNLMNEKWNKNQLKDKLLEVYGFSDITASKFSDNFEEFKRFFSKLSKVVDLSHLTEIKQNEQNQEQNQNNKPLAGKIYVFTGFRDKELEAKIVSKGGKVGSSVSSKTTAVIKLDDSDDRTSKILDAEKLGVSIINKSDFVNSLG